MGRELGRSLISMFVVAGIFGIGAVLFFLWLWHQASLVHLK